MNIRTPFKTLTRRYKTPNNSTIVKANRKSTNIDVADLDPSIPVIAGNKMAATSADIPVIDHLPTVEETRTATSPRPSRSTSVVSPVTLKELTCRISSVSSVPSLKL
jgi:hypothetical protein